jgi:hypothetical protein
MFFRTLRQLFHSFPLYVRVLLIATSVGLLLIFLAQRELVNNAIHLLQALPPVVMLPVGYRQSPKEEESKQTVEQNQSSS